MESLHFNTYSADYCQYFMILPIYRVIQEESALLWEMIV
jgi:hypothetical protein